MSDHRLCDSRENYSEIQISEPKKKSLEMKNKKLRIVISMNFRQSTCDHSDVPNFRSKMPITFIVFKSNRRSDGQQKFSMVPEQQQLRFLRGVRDACDGTLKLSV